MWNFLIFIVVLVLFFILFLNIASLKYKNSYRLTMIFGKKGSGKSTTLTRLALEAERVGKEVYANIPLPGAHLIKESDIGFFDIPPESVLIVDEAGMIWDNRHFEWEIGRFEQSKPYFEWEIGILGEAVGIFSGKTAILSGKAGLLRGQTPILSGKLAF